MMGRYKHIFFDLDHTLWDFKSNSRATLLELHEELGLAALGVEDTGEFIATYEEINEHLWGRLGQGGMGKEVLRVLRFRNTLLHFGVREDRLSRRLGELYLERCPQRTALMPGAIELLQALQGDHRMHIITNGFHEVQQVKLEQSGLLPMLDIVLTSEQAGCRKPDPRIFMQAMAKAGARVEESLMVGDSITADMAGARGVEMDHAHLHDDVPPDPLATYRVDRLDRLKALIL